MLLLLKINEILVKLYGESMIRLTDYEAINILISLLKNRQQPNRTRLFLS